MARIPLALVGHAALVDHGIRARRRSGRIVRNLSTENAIAAAPDSGLAEQHRRTHHDQHGQRDERRQRQRGPRGGTLRRLGRRRACRAVRRTTSGGPVRARCATRGRGATSPPRPSPRRPCRRSRHPQARSWGRGTVRTRGRGRQCRPRPGFRWCLGQATACGVTGARSPRRRDSPRRRSAARPVTSPPVNGSVDDLVAVLALTSDARVRRRVARLARIRVRERRCRCDRDESDPAGGSEP